jgi:signal transduction histidine kinase
MKKTNKLLNLQKEEIETLNDDLESKVKERTKHLENANQKLVDYSFSNSHIVRRPLASILGLISIFNYENISDPLNIQILEMLQMSAKELDEVVLQINKDLEREKFN